MCCESLADFPPRSETLDVFDLHLLDDGEELAIHEFDDWEEGAMAQWSIWSYTGPIIGNLKTVSNINDLVTIDTYCPDRLLPGRILVSL